MHLTLYNKHLKILGIRLGPKNAYMFTNPLKKKYLTKGRSKNDFTEQTGIEPMILQRQH